MLFLKKKLMKTRYLILLIFLCEVAMAQNTQTIVLYSDTGDQKEVLTIDRQTNQLIVKQQELTTENNYFDAFIVKPSKDNPDTYYLISAQENQLFLKRNGHQIEFGDIQSEPENSLVNYQWEIQYFGYPYVALSDPSDQRKVVFIENQTLVLKNVPDQNWNLSNNSDSKGNPYRFKIKKLYRNF